MPRKRARSTSSNDTTVRNVRTKEMAFAERYDTANKTKEQVLGKYYFVVFPGVQGLCVVCINVEPFDVALQMKNWSSACYKHFKPPVIVEEKGEIKYQFMCQTYVPFFLTNIKTHILKTHRNPSIILTQKCEEDSTTNLLRHVKSCNGQVVNESQSIAHYAHGSSYSKAELRYLISLWVIQCHRPFTIIEDISLQRIFKMLYAKVETPSHDTISRDVREIHGISKAHVGKYLQVTHVSSNLHVYTKTGSKELYR